MSEGTGIKVPALIFYTAGVKISGFLSKFTMFKDYITDLDLNAFLETT